MRRRPHVAERCPGRRLLRRPVVDKTGKADSCGPLSGALAERKAQNDFVTLAYTVRRGPNCGAPTPMPVPSRSS